MGDEIASSPFTDKESALQRGKATSLRSHRFPWSWEGMLPQGEREEHQGAGKPRESPGRDPLEQSRESLPCLSPSGFHIQSSALAGNDSEFSPTPALSNAAAISSSFFTREALSHVMGLHQ